MAKGAPCKEADLEKNGETCKNLPWVFQIFKSDVKSGALESSDFDEKLRTQRKQKYIDLGKSKKRSVPLYYDLKPKKLYLTDFKTKTGSYKTNSITL